MGVLMYGAMCIDFVDFVHKLGTIQNFPYQTREMCGVSIEEYVQDFKMSFKPLRKGRGGGVNMWTIVDVLFWWC